MGTNPMESAGCYGVITQVMLNPNSKLQEIYFDVSQLLVINFKSYLFLQLNFSIQAYKSYINQGRFLNIYFEICFQFLRATKYFISIRKTSCCANKEYSDYNDILEKIIRKKDKNTAN